MRVCPPIQGTQIQSLVWEDRICLSAAKSVYHNYRACALEPRAAATEPICCNYYSPCALETVLHNKRNHRNESLCAAEKSSAAGHSWRKLTQKQQRPSAANIFLKNSESRGTFLVVQWIGIHLPMRGTQVQFLVWKDSTYRGATTSMYHNYWSLSVATKTQHSQKKKRDLEHKTLYSVSPLWVESILMFVYEPIITFTYVFLLTVHQTFFSVTWTSFALWMS